MQDPSLFAQVQHQQPQVQPFPEQEHLKCPRCDSGNTKFCYYNNYNLSQPRHFCKSCRRYWTKGGTLRNIPVGGGSRKNAKRTSSSASSSPTSSASSAKRPASYAPPPSDSRSNDGDGMPPKGDADGFEGGQFGDFTGASFSSLLGSAEGHFSNLLDPGSGQNTDPDGNAADGFLGGWSGGSNELPDLSMYTPGSSSFL